MSRADASEAFGLGFDHGAEVVAAPGALLLPLEVSHCVRPVGDMGPGAPDFSSVGWFLLILFFAWVPNVWILTRLMLSTRLLEKFTMIRAFLAFGLSLIVAIPVSVALPVVTLLLPAAWIRVAPGPIFFAVSAITPILLGSALWRHSQKKEGTEEQEAKWN